MANSSSNTPRTTNRKHLARQEREQNQMRYLLIAMIAVAVIIIGVIGYGILDQTVLRSNRAVADVNGEKITIRDLQTRVRYERWRLVNQYTNLYNYSQMFAGEPSFQQYFTDQMSQISTQLSDSAGFAKTILDYMVQDKVIAQEAKKRGISISEDELNKAIEDAFEYYPNGTPTPTITPTSFVTPTFSSTLLSYVTMTPIPSATLEPTATATPENVTPTPEPPTATPAPTFTPMPTSTITPTPTEFTYEGYQNMYKTAIANLSEVQFNEKDIRDLFRSQLLRDKVMAAITADMKPEAEQVYARHILVPEQAVAVVVLERLKAGESFDALAKELSTDTSNKDSGGVLGWFSKGQMVAEFETAAFSLPVGQYSDPVQTSYGWHIIQVLDKRVVPLTATEFENAKSTFFTNWLTEQTSAETVKTLEIPSDMVPTEPSIPANMVAQ